MAGGKGHSSVKREKFIIRDSGRIDMLDFSIAGVTRKPQNSSAARSRPGPARGWWLGKHELIINKTEISKRAAELRQHFDKINQFYANDHACWV